MKNRLNYFYKNARLPSDPHTAQIINLAAKKLFKKLSSLDVGKVNISEYNKGYLSNKLEQPLAKLELYSHLLALALSHRKKPLDQLTFVEYGGGTGLMSLLAKQSGVGKVIYNDIYDVSCTDAKVIARELAIPADEYVCGDIDDLSNFLNSNSISIDAIASYDVIEHIYDIRQHIQKLRTLSSSEFQVVYGSGANIKNPLVRGQLVRQQIKVENQDRERKSGHKERDTLKSYLSLRKEIIALYDPSLSEETVLLLAQATRGLIKSDIEHCVEVYKQKGIIAHRPDGSTNTCDPLTGNWNEHLMDLNWLKNLFIESGFNVEIQHGYYRRFNSPALSLVGNALNVFMDSFKRAALHFSPYYVVCASSLCSP